MKNEIYITGDDKVNPLFYEPWQDDKDELDFILPKGVL